jgi:hypothetical protein
MKYIIILTLIVAACAGGLFWFQGRLSVPGVQVDIGKSGMPNSPDNQSINEIRASPSTMRFLDVVLNQGSDDNSRQRAALNIEIHAVNLDVPEMTKRLLGEKEGGLNLEFAMELCVKVSPLMTLGALENAEESKNKNRLVEILAQKTKENPEKLINEAADLSLSARFSDEVLRKVYFQYAPKAAVDFNAYATGLFQFISRGNLRSVEELISLRWSAAQDNFHVDQSINYLLLSRQLPVEKLKEVGVILREKKDDAAKSEGLMVFANAIDRLVKIHEQ